MLATRALFRRYALPTTVIASTVAATYIAATSLSDISKEGTISTTPAKKRKPTVSDPSQYKDLATYEKLSLNDVYSRYEIKTLDKTKRNENVLGEGSYAHVIGCTELKTGKSVALKVIKKAFTKPPDFEREVSALIAARIHPNVVQLLDVIDVPEADTWLLVTELLEGGELFDRVLTRGAFSEKRAAVLVKKVASALSTLHRLGWTHNDVKPENLVYEDKSPDSEIKLVDFGMARRYPDTSEHQILTKNLGTTTYWSPELLDPKTRFTSDPRAIDAWTLGVLTYILLFACHPFDRTGDASEEVSAQRIASSNIPGESYLCYDCFEDRVVSDSAIQFMQALLDPNPQTRMTVEQAYSHPWILESLKTTDEEDEEAHSATDDIVSRRLRGERDTQQALAAVLQAATEGSASRDAFHMLGDEGALPMVDIQDEFLKGLKSDLDKRHLHTYNGIIYDVGDRTAGMYVLVNGKAQLEYTSDRSKDADRKHSVVQTLVPGDVFGETAILEGRGHRNSLVRTIGGPVQAYFFSREDVVAVLSANSELKERLDELSARRYRLRASSALMQRVESGESFGKHVTIAKGEKIFSKGELAENIYLVKSGLVKSVDTTAESEEIETEVKDENISPEQVDSNTLKRALGRSKKKKGNRVIVGEWGPGDVFGISGLYGSPRFASAIAQTPVQLVVVPRKELERLLEHEPSLRENLLQQFRAFKERNASISRKRTHHSSTVSKNKDEVQSNVTASKENEKGVNPSGAADPSVKEEPIEGSVVLQMKKGDYVFKRGDPSDSGVFFVHEGVVHLIDEHGKLRHVNRERQLFGNESFLKHAKRRYSAVVASDTVKLVRVRMRAVGYEDEEEDDEPPSAQHEEETGDKND